MTFIPRQFRELSSEERTMRVCGRLALVLFAGVALTTARADDIKSGPDKRIAGPFDVKAITGASKGRTLCYV
jgi:hypothetical protein